RRVGASGILSRVYRSRFGPPCVLTAHPDNSAPLTKGEMPVIRSCNVERIRLAELTFIPIARCEYREDRSPTRNRAARDDEVFTSVSLGRGFQRTIITQ